MPAAALKLEPGEIELFRAGDYPQAKYTAEQVAQIAASYDPENEHRAYLKAGHKDGGMAYGVFDRLRAWGESLIGHLADATPQPVKDAFAQAQVSGWSSEIYPNYKGKGPYLKAVALLGATPPAVKGLKAALDFEQQDDAGDVQYFAMVPDHTTNAEGQPAPPKETQMAENKPAGNDAPKGDEKPVVDVQKFAELEAENAALKLAQAESEKRLKAIELGGLRSAINTFAETQHRDGKLIKADMDAGVAAFMEAIDGVQFKSGEADAEARHWFMEFVQRRVTAVPQGVTKPGRTGTNDDAVEVHGADVPVDPASVDFREQVEAYATEKKISYGDAHKALLRKHNPYRTAGA